MKIALFTTSFPSNSETAVNAGACVKDFADSLTDLGHEVEVLTPYKRGARHDFRHANTTYFRWLGSEDSLSHLGKSPIGLLRLCSVALMGTVAGFRLLRRFRPDHVLCFWVFPCGLWARLAPPWIRAPYSLWALGSDIWDVGRRPGFSLILRWLGRDARHLFADGLLLRNEFQTLVGRRVDFLATSRVLQVPAGAPKGAGGYYLFLGRYHPNKGIDLLIEAIGRAKDRLPPGFCLRAHGFGPLERHIRSRVQALGIESLVQINGPSTRDVSTVLRLARGLIIPSRIESIPLVLSDGLQMGLPVMVTEVGDMGTLVRGYGAGLVCRPEIDDIAETLLRFVNWIPDQESGARLSELLDIRASAKRFLTDIEIETQASSAKDAATL